MPNYLQDFHPEKYLMKSDEIQRINEVEDEPMGWDDSIIKIASAFRPAHLKHGDGDDSE